MLKSFTISFKTCTLPTEVAPGGLHFPPSPSGRAPWKPTPPLSPPEGRGLGAQPRGSLPPLPAVPGRPPAFPTARGLPRRRLLLRAGRGRPSEGGPRRVAVRRRVATMAVLLETTLGDLVIDLYTEERPRGRSAAGRGRGSRGGRGVAPCAGGWKLRVAFAAAPPASFRARMAPGPGEGSAGLPPPLWRGVGGRTPGSLPCGSGGSGGRHASRGFAAARGRRRGRWASLPHPVHRAAPAAGPAAPPASGREAGPFARAVAT